MAYQLFNLPKALNISSNLTLLSGAKALFELTGTSTPTNTYQDSALTTPHTNPVVADSAGVFPKIYLDPTIRYRLTLKDSADATLPGYPLDDINDQILSQAIIGAILNPRTAAEIAASVTPTDYAYPAGSPYYDTRRNGAVTDGVTSNTTAVQNSLNALGSSTSGGGGIVFNQKGSRFTLTSLTFPARSTLLYYGGDDASDSSVVGTNELRYFIANANASGIVNENRLEASFHPGNIVNVRKAVTGHDAFLGGGQSRTNPARGSYSIQDDDIDRFRIVYENYNPFSAFSGYRLHSWVRRITLSGVNTGSFVTDPVYGDLITGSTSGAKGFVISIDGTELVVGWISGSFQVGETVTDTNETSSTTISAIVVSLVEAHALSQDNHRGYFGVGVPGGEAWDLLSVGGAAAFGPTRSMGQYVHDTVTNPLAKWIDAWSSTANGLSIRYDVAPAAAARRLKIHKQTSGVLGGYIAHVGAIGAHGEFNDATALSASAFNISSITKNATGDYTINFVNAFATADYSVSFSVSDPNDYPYVFTRTTTQLRVRVATNGTPGTLRNITGVLDVHVAGGDI